MSTVVIMPGGFHPFHAGHLALYQAAQRAFPDAEVFVAATNDTSERPFPFAVKEKLAQLAGVSPNRFYQVKSPFRAEEITAKFDPEKDTLIFVRSEKDADKPPKPGIVKKDGSAGYLQPLLGAQRLEPFSRHAYMAYLPTVEFGPGMTSATEIRQAWPQLNDQRKKALVMSLYPRTQDNDRLANTVIKMLDTAIVAESIDPITANTSGAGAGMTSTMSRRYNQPAMEATVVNDPEQGLQIRPAGGLGTWTESSLVSNLTRQIQELNRMLDSGNYQGIEYVLYRGGAMQAKIQALAALQRFKQKQGRRPIARGREIEVDEDYVEEKWSEKYKKSINCSNPKGFSQRAHCAGRRKNEDVVETQLAEKCWDTHRQAGMKKKGNRMVPNCVPKESQ